MRFVVVSVHQKDPQKSTSGDLPFSVAHTHTHMHTLLAVITMTNTFTQTKSDFYARSPFIKQATIKQIVLYNIPHLSGA